MKYLMILELFYNNWNNNFFSKTEKFRCNVNSFESRMSTVQKYMYAFKCKKKKKKITTILAPNIFQTQNISGKKFKLDPDPLQNHHRTDVTYQCECIQRRSRLLTSSPGRKIMHLNVKITCRYTHAVLRSRI